MIIYQKQYQRKIGTGPTHPGGRTIQQHFMPLPLLPCLAQVPQSVQESLPRQLHVAHHLADAVRCNKRYNHGIFQREPHIRRLCIEQDPNILQLHSSHKQDNHLSRRKRGRAGVRPLTCPECTTQHTQTQEGRLREQANAEPSRRATQRSSEIHRTTKNTKKKKKRQPADAWRSKENKKNCVFSPLFLL